jgi:hypothetical protein
VKLSELEEQTVENRRVARLLTDKYLGFVLHHFDDLIMCTARNFMDNSNTSFDVDLCVQIAIFSGPVVNSVAITSSNGGVAAIQTAQVSCPAELLPSIGTPLLSHFKCNTFS